MGRFRGYELFLGALFATALWATFSAINPNHAASQQQAQHSASDQAENISETEKADDRLARYTLWLTIFTGVLAVSTIGLWIVTWRGSAKQSRDMKSAVAAAQAANEISSKALIAEQRAWLAVGDLRAEKDVAVASGNILFSVKITNYGKTPAVAVHTTMDMCFDLRGTPDAIKSIAHKARLDETHWTRIVFPGESYRRDWSLDLYPADHKSDATLPNVVGCVTYRTIFDEMPHQTAFAYGLFVSNGIDPNTFISLIRLDAGVIEKNYIGYQANPGGFSD